MANRPILRIERKTFNNGKTFIVVRSNLPRKVRFHWYTGRLKTVSGQVEGYARSHNRTEEDHWKDMKMLAEANLQILGHLENLGRVGPRGCGLFRFTATPLGRKNTLAKAMNGRTFRNVMRGETQVVKTVTAHKWGWGCYNSQALALEEAQPI